MVDLDRNDEGMRGMNKSQRELYDLVSEALDVWAKMALAAGLRSMDVPGLELDYSAPVGFENAAPHEEAFWIVYFSVVDQAAKLAALGEPQKGAEEAVRKLTIDYRRALERHMGLPKVTSAEPPATPRTPSPEDIVVKLRLRTPNLMQLERGIVLGRDACGVDITMRLVRQGGEYVIEMTGPPTASAEVPDAVDHQPAGEVDVVKCFACGNMVPLEETVTRKVPINEGKWTGHTSRIVCLPCAAKSES